MDTRRGGRRDGELQDCRREYGEVVLVRRGDEERSAGWTRWADEVRLGRVGGGGFARWSVTLVGEVRLAGEVGEVRG